MAEAQRTESKFNMLDLQKQNMRKGKKTQTYVLAEIFHENIKTTLSKAFIEKEIVRRLEGEQPGDLQRNIRTFCDKFEKYGLKKKETVTGLKPEYIWDPIDKSQLEDIIHPAARNLFKRPQDKKNFSNSKNNKCEMCGDNKRMAIDHWRAHSVYNIDSIDIAVLLCEKCNNIHHNYDASKIAVKYIYNIDIIKNWVKKENEIRCKGKDKEFSPNKADLETQQQNIKEIIDYYKNYSITIPQDFWEGLI